MLKRRYPYMSTTKAVITKVTPEGLEVELGTKNKTKGYIAAQEYAEGFEGKVGDTVSVAVIGIDGANYVVNLSIRRFDQVQNRKVVAQYLKQAPRPTLGQLLQGSFEEETEDEEKTAEGVKPEAK